MSGGILPLFTNVNATPLWGAGGGGGSVGPNLTVSTVTMPYAANTTPLSIGTTSNGNSLIAGAFTANGNANLTVFANQGSNQTGLAIQTDAGNSQTSVYRLGTGVINFSNVGNINGSPYVPVGSNPTFATVAAQTYMNVANQNGGGNNLRFESLNSQTFQLHVINGVGDPGIRIGASNNTVTINDADLQVTTINGAPYVPGGISADPIVSTLRAFPGNDPQASVYIGGTPNNVVAIRNGSTLQSYIDLDLRDAGGVSTDLARMNVIHDYGLSLGYSQNAGAIFKGSVQVLSSISNQGGGVVLTGADNTTLIVGNGSARVAGGVVPGAQTVGLSNFSVGLASVPGGNNAYPLSQDFNIQNGKTYRISGNFAFENGEVGTHTDIAVVGGGAGFPAYIYSVNNGFATPQYNGLAGGYGTVFLATSDATCQVVAYNTATTTSTIIQTQTLNAKWVLENLGTI